MKLFIAFFISSCILLMGCSKQTAKENKSFLYSDSSYATIQIGEKDTSVYNYGSKFKSSSISYSRAYIAPNDSLHTYLIKETATTTGWTDEEKNKKTIHLELKRLDKLNQSGIHFEYSCDHITLNTDHYIVTTYGCCGAEDKIALFDYKNTLLIKGDGKIITAKIPNSKIKFYIAFENTYSDSTQFGILHISYNNEETYHIHVKLGSKKCEPFSPTITIHTKNSKDKFINSNEYQLWSFEKIESSNELKDLTIKMIFYCDPLEKIIEIPIINGKPFGKKEKDQEYNK